MVLELPQKRLINNLQELDSFTRDLAKFIKKKPLPFYILLTGELGAGKTTLTRFLLHRFGIKGPVTSPTFVILNQYNAGQLTINHMDAYRLTEKEDLSQYEELFHNSLNVIEWPEHLNFEWEKLPHLKIKIKSRNKSTRLIEME